MTALKSNLNMSLFEHLNSSSVINFTNDLPTTEINRQKYSSSLVLVDFRKFYRFGFETELYGYVFPVLTLCITLINCLMIAAFIKKRLFSATHVVLIGIAVYDMVTCLLPAVFWFYFFGVLRYKYYLPYGWCRVWEYSARALPILFHTNSIYLTAILAIQRIIVVKYPFRAKLWCSRKTTLVCIVISFILSFAILGIGFFEIDFTSYPVPLQNDNGTMMLACRVLVPDFVGTTVEDLYSFMGIRHWIRVFLINVIPLILLVAMEIVLIYEVRQLRKERNSMNVSTNKDLSDKTMRKMTKMTSLCVGIFILAELPTALVIIFDCIQLNFHITVVPDHINRSFIVVLNLLIIATANVNFVVYSCLSKSFKACLIRMFCPKCKKGKVTSTRYTISAWSTNLHNGETYQMKDT